MSRGDDLDPKNLIREAFVIEGITKPECRSIFLDWALSLGPGLDPKAAIPVLLERYEAAQDHPMRAVLNEGLATAPKSGRRGGRAARVSNA